MSPDSDYGLSDPKRPTTNDPSSDGPPEREGEADAVRPATVERRASQTEINVDPSVITDAPRSRPRPGCFVAVVGKSGAGKDTLLQLAAAQLKADPTIRFARRVVTRTAHAALEDHDELSSSEFDAAEQAGRFCLSWRAHNLSYGLPANLTDDLAAGRTVVANVSRRVLCTAVERFARLAVIEITAPRSLLIERLAARGRETPAEIEARLSRQVELMAPSGVEAIYRVINDGSAEAGAAMMRTKIKQVAHPQFASHSAVYL